MGKECSMHGAKQKCVKISIGKYDTNRLHQSYRRESNGGTEMDQKCAGILELSDRCARDSELLKE